MKPAPFALLTALLLSACSHSDPAQDNGQLTPATGHGRLLSVDQILGTGTLDVDGKTVTFWWQNRMTRGAQGPAADSAPESVQIDIPFKADIGDTIYYRGFTSRGEIYITAATAVKK